MGEEVRYTANPLKISEDGEQIRAFIQSSPKWPTFLIRPVMEHLGAFRGWCYGGLKQGGSLRAIACVEDRVAHIYGQEPGAIRALAQSMLRQTKGRTALGGHSHQIIGEVSVIEIFWDIFRSVSRTVMSDRRRILMSAENFKEIGGKGPLKMRKALSKDFKLIYEFRAEQSVEQWGIDPRRMSKQQHEAHCKAAIDSGQQWIGFDRGRPVMICELLERPDGVVFLERFYMPKPMQRKRVMRRALAALIQEGLKRSREVAMMIDGHREEWIEVGDSVGLETRAQYRLLILR